MKYKNIVKFYIFILVFFIAIGIKFLPFDKGIKNTDEFISTSIALGNRYYFSVSSNQNTFTNFDLKKNNTISNVRTETIKDNGNALFYNASLHYWMMIFGTSDFATRFMSIFFSILTIFLIYFFTFNLFKSHNIALLTLILVAVNPLYFRYCFETRGYSLGGFLTLLSTFAFVKIVFDEKIKNKSLLIIYIISSILSLLTHYLSVYILIFQFLFLIVFYRKKTLLNFLSFSFLVIFLFYGIWLLLGGLEGFQLMKFQDNMFLQQAINPISRCHFFNLASPGNIVKYTIELYTFICGTEYYWHLVEIGIKFRYIFLILVIPILLLVLGYYYEKDEIKKKKYLLILMLGFASIVFSNVLAIKSGHTASYAFRYSYFSIAYILILFSYSLNTLFTLKSKYFKLFAVLSALILIVFPIIILSEKIQTPLGKNKYVLLAKEINNKYLPKDTVVYSDKNEARIINIYLWNKKDTFIQKIDTAISKENFIIKNKSKIIYIKKGTKSKEISYWW